VFSGLRLGVHRPVGESFFFALVGSGNRTVGTATGSNLLALAWQCVPVTVFGPTVFFMFSLLFCFFMGWFSLVEGVIGSVEVMVICFLCSCVSVINISRWEVLYIYGCDCFCLGVRMGWSFNLFFVIFFAIFVGIVVII